MTNCQRGACECVCAQTGRWCHMSMRGADDLERERERAKDRKRKGESNKSARDVDSNGSVCFALRVRLDGRGISATTSSLHFLCSPSLPVPHTQLHGALTQQHNEQELTRGRRSKVFPVTRTAASTQTHTSGTTLA